MSDEKELDGASNPNAEETKPINNVDKPEAEVDYKMASRGGCYMTKLQRALALVVVALLLVIVAVLAGFIGWSYRSCATSGHPNGGDFNSSRYITPRPTVDPALPWSNIRLPRDLIPSGYDLRLKVDLTRFIFYGSVDIRVTCTEPTWYVIVNINDLNITESVVSVRESISGRAVDIRRQVAVPINQFYVLELADQLRTDVSYRIRFGNFSGHLKDDLRGLYRSHYKTSDGKTR